MQYQIRDEVWLENTNIYTNQPSKKLGQKQYGPFQIKEKVGEAAYWLVLPKGWAIHDVFNEQLLTLVQKAAFPRQRKLPAPEPVIINNKEEYKVEEIQGQ